MGKGRAEDWFCAALLHLPLAPQVFGLLLALHLKPLPTYIFLAPHMNSLAPSKSEEQVGWALRKFSRVAKVSASRYP